MLEWYVRRALPEEYRAEARARGITAHDLLIEKVKQPWANAVVAADWWNGSRNAPSDLRLTGTITGLTLDTRPEQIYLGLLQAIACGTRDILTLCESHGVAVHRLLAAGGAANKNGLLMREYAAILDRPIDVAQVREVPALGAAMFAAVAAGIYESPVQAYAHMGVKDFTRYVPDAANRDAYARLYRKNRAMREMLLQLGEMRL